MSTTSHKGHTTSAAKGSSKSNDKTAASSKAPGRSNKEAENSKLNEFFHDEIKDIYWAEKKLVQTLPKLSKAATSEQLRDAFTTHLEQTKEHVTRLEKVFDLLGHKPQAKKCDAMEGITEEGASVIEDTDEGTSTRDVALILAGQKAEHYEIATYGGLAQIARTLGHDDVAKLLETTLQEEKDTDELLSELAENSINEDATED
jgi:ferritin-like metal-binding protein YciE